MSNKIVSICMTIFMLSMCILAITTMSIVNMKRSQDVVVERAGNAVVSTDGEIESDGTIQLRGTSLISAIEGTKEIDDRMPLGKDKIYSYTTAGKTKQSRYFFRFGSLTDNTKIIENLEPNHLYDVKYEFSGDLVNVTIGS